MKCCFFQVPKHRIWHTHAWRCMLRLWLISSYSTTICGRPCREAGWTSDARMFADTLGLLENHKHYYWDWDWNHNCYTIDLRTSYAFIELFNMMTMNVKYNLTEKQYIKINTVLNQNELSFTSHGYYTRYLSITTRYKLCLPKFMVTWQSMCTVALRQGLG